jgi:hypothetical protein
MAEDRANDSARQPELPYKGLEGKKNIALVSRPSHGYEGSGGRIRVIERTPEELGPREMTKFDKTNKYHVGLLTSTDDSTKDMMIHPGGYFSFPKKEATERKMIKKPAKATDGQAPIAGTASAAQARATALAANEAKMAAVRKNLAASKKK